MAHCEPIRQALTTAKAAHGVAIAAAGSAQRTADTLIQVAESLGQVVMDLEQQLADCEAEHDIEEAAQDFWCASYMDAEGPPSKRANMADEALGEFRLRFGRDE